MITDPDTWSILGTVAQKHNLYFTSSVVTVQTGGTRAMRSFHLIPRRKEKIKDAWMRGTTQARVQNARRLQGSCLFQIFTEREADLHSRLPVLGCPARLLGQAQLSLNLYRS